MTIRPYVLAAGVLGLLGGYAVESRSSRLQPESTELPVATGDRIILTFDNSSQADCLVSRVAGAYVTCRPDGNGTVHSHNLALVRSVSRETTK